MHFYYLHYGVIMGTAVIIDVNIKHVKSGLNF